MTVLQQLTDDYNRHARRVFDRAVEHTQKQIDETPPPIDTGRLESRIAQRDVFAASPTFRVTFESQAKSGDGTDYPAILEELPFIAPRRAKYLRWIDSRTGKPVFSKGFKNRHYRWWSRMWVEREIWHEGVARAVAEIDD